MHHSRTIAKLGRLLIFIQLIIIVAVFAPGPSPVRADPSDGGADRVFGQSSFTTQATGSGLDRLRRPTGVGVDRGTGKIYVADRENQRVLGWSSATGFTYASAAEFVISTGAGSDPTFVAVDSIGKIYVTDYGRHVIRRYSPPPSLTLEQTMGNLGTSGSGASSLNGPWAMTFDKSDNLYVADAMNNRVLYFPAGETTATKVLGQPDFNQSAANNGGISASSLNQPRGVAVDSLGNVYVSDTGNNRVLKYGSPLTNGMSAIQVIGQANYTSDLADCGGTVSAVCLNWPAGIAVNSMGNFFVADVNNNRVLGFLKSSGNIPTASGLFGQISYTTKSSGPAANLLNQPYGVALDALANVYIADYFNNRVLGFDGPYLQSMYLPLVIR